MKPPKWTNEQRIFLIEHYSDFSNKELGVILGRTEAACKKLGQTLRLKKSPETLSRTCSVSNSGQFKSGRHPHNTLVDGAIVTRRDKQGRLISRIRIGLNQWEELQKYNWRQAGNDIPPGYVLAFKDGDSQNCSVDNLELITRAQLLARNQRKDKGDPENIGRKTKSLSGHETVRISKKAPEVINRVNKQLRRAKRTADFDIKERKRVAIEAARDRREAESLLRSLERQKKAEEANLERQRKREQKMAIRLAEKEAAEKQLKADAASRKKAQKVAKARKEAFMEERSREAQKVLPARVIDVTQLVPLRIDAKTIIWIKPGVDPEVIRNKFLSRGDMRNSLP
jgi:hypothetical protein